MPSGWIHFQQYNYVWYRLKISAHSRTVTRYLDASLTEEQVSSLADQLSIKKMKSNPAVNHEDRHAQYFQLYLGNLKPQSGPFRMQCFLDRAGLTQFQRQFSPQGEVSWGGVLCEKGGGWWLEGIFHTGHNFSSWNISQFLLLARDQRFSTAFFSFRKWKQFSIPGWHSRVVKYLFTGNKSGNKSVLCVNLHCNYTQQQVWFVS